MKELKESKNEKIKQKSLLQIKRISIKTDAIIKNQYFMANCNKVAPDIKVEKLRINKIIEMLVISAESEEKAREQLDLLSDRLFANVED